MGLKEALAQGKFAVTSEVGPPKGTNVEEMLHCAELVKDRVDAINVTDNQSAVMRLSSLGGCALLLQRGIEPVFQVTCRDRNRLGIQSDLLAAAALGVKNVLSLTGDHVSAGDHKEARGVFDMESVQLLQVLHTLNGGKDMAGGDLDGAPSFFPGAIVTPEAIPLEPQLAKFVKKVRAGAKFFQTQAVYDVENFKRFMDYARKFDVKILAGILLLRSAGMAKYLNKNVPGITVPAGIIEEIEGAEKPGAKGIEIAARLITEMRPFCDGVHVMAVGAEQKVPEILDAAGL